MLGKHKNVALQFSGGKDSLACLHYMRPYWEQLVVVWLNTGDAFPETIEQMDGIRMLVPHFIEVMSDQPTQIKQSGYPADVLSAWDTPVGRAIDPTRPNRTQAAFGCCGENIWRPMAEAMRKRNITLIIRGQREAERLKAPTRSGYVEEGIEYLYPIESWTDRQVFDYLREHAIPLPKSYEYMNTSLDCQHCTGYLFENLGKFRYISHTNPKLYEELRVRLSYIGEAVHSELKHLDDILAEPHNGR
jgi:phosphoadenosine phosphosulfate reductase